MRGAAQLYKTLTPKQTRQKAQEELDEDPQDRYEQGDTDDQGYDLVEPVGLERPRPSRGPGPFIRRFGGSFGSNPSRAAAIPAILGIRAEQGAAIFAVGHLSPSVVQWSFHTNNGCNLTKPYISGPRLTPFCMTVHSRGAAV
jgi:hypothetical protein